ncbi:MAG: superoxide dismutase [Ruminococcaceae bacterium]|nr:superoxide dismutase [Oscillospiraceae bacterium]
MYDHYPFQLLPLPYAYNALEPYIDAETVEIHHDRHLKAYVDHLNEALQPYPQLHNMTLEQLLINSDRLPKCIQTAVINNGGGVYNHNFYFNIMGPVNHEPGAQMLRAIEKAFGSYSNFKEQLKEAAVNRFGSGYAWLAANRCGDLKILSTANQDTLLKTSLKPILLIDVWEHAYYLKYKNLRPDYAENWFNVLDWFQVESFFQKA